MAQCCEKCKVTVVGEQPVCPLCQGQLSGAGDPQAATFPFIDTIMHRYNLLIRILFFISAVLVVICFAVNYMLSYPSFWSFFVAVGVVCMWLSVGIVVRKRHNIPKTILWQAILYSLLVLVLDWMTGWHHWALDYAAPCFLIVAILGMWAVAFILRLRLEDFLVYLLLDAVIGIVPAFFLAFDLVEAKIPSLLCVLASAISLIALLTFKDKAVGNEVKKRLHI